MAIVNTPKKPRLRLLNKLTLVVLIMTSLWALWLVAPTQTMLIRLIERSSSPEVSLAFLQQLHHDSPKNVEVIKLLASNYKKLGEYEEANELLTSILTTEQGETNWEALDLYLTVLWEQYSQESSEQKVCIEKTILALLNTTELIPDPIVANNFADIALQLSMPKKAFNYLYPHRAHNTSNYQELIGLALQNEDYDSAVALQAEQFHQFENLEQANALFSLLLSGNRPKGSKEFLLRYTGKLSQDPEFLSSAIHHSSQIGNLDVTLILSHRLLAIAPSAERYSQTATVAVALGKLDTAKQLLDRAIETKPNRSDLSLLHQIYRWQGDIENAQRTSIALVSLSPEEAYIRDGIEESRALGDIYHEGILYHQLAEQNLIKTDEYTQWLFAVENGSGTQTAQNGVWLLAAKRPKDSELVSQAARLYSYQSNHNAVITQWNKLIALRSPNQQEAMLAANAYIMTRNPDMALKSLIAPNNWQEADADYLESIASLAWETGNKEIAEVSQEKLASISSDSMDTYRYIQLKSPMTSKQIAEVVELYKRTNKPELILAAIRATYEANDAEQLKKLLSLAAQNPQLINSTDVINYQAQLAIMQGDTLQARALLERILTREPTNAAAANNLIWLALQESNRDELQRLYQKYKKPFAEQYDLWLAFASASQFLGHYQEANGWYRQILLRENGADLSTLLNYASLLDQQENSEAAYQIRRYIIEQKSEQLLLLDDDQLSFRELVSIFMGERFAYSMIENKALNAPTANRTFELFGHYLANNQSERILLWQQKSALGKYTLPDWQQLALAIQKKDKQTINHLLENAINLPASDQNTALQMVGKHQQAWEQGQSQIGKISNKQTESQLKRAHVTQHPNKTHSIRSQVTNISQWDVTRYSLDYYAPHKYGDWRLGTDYQQSDAPEKLTGANIDDEFRLRAKYANQTDDSLWVFSIDLAEGLGDQRLGINGEYQTNWRDYFSIGARIGFNNHIEASELLNIAGEDDYIGLNFSYQPTFRESLALQVNYHKLSTRFDDGIGKGWDINLRASEQLFFADPAWQIYADVTLQSIDLDNNPLSGINGWYKGNTPLVSGDFIDDKYQRFAIGQRLWHGEPGQPGATVPSPRYWLDSSLGYNVEESRADLALSAGLGWRVFGNDELYLTTNWQSQDRNGDSSLNIAFGYYYSY